jgi:hypothetical protein
MRNGFLGYKLIGWSGAALLAVTAIMPHAPSSAWNMLKTGMQSRPGLLKKSSGSGGTTTTTTSSGSTTTTTTTTTTSSNTGTTTPTATEFSIIPSNFDVNSELVDMAVPGKDTDMGAFRFICNPGQISADDPIVFPGQPGKSHLHQFYGNTSANAYSTYQSLRSSGQSTCMSPLNRSAYWMPAMLDGKGNVVRPDYISIYYKRRPSSDPSVQAWKPAPDANKSMGIATSLPNGLRFIFGWDPTGMHPAERTGTAWFNCDGPTAVPGQYATIAEAMAHCPAGNHFGAVINAPQCWDGKNLDVPDHRSHVSYATYSNGYGYLQCDQAHPYVIPEFTLGAWYTVAPGDDTSKWHFSSDEMVPDQPAGYTFHADWFGAWDNTVMSMWMDNCINKLLNCSAGNLGNGKGMKMFSGFSWTANPRLVPIPQ